MIEIPLNSSPEQIFDITINGVVYSFRVIYNTRSETWSADISRRGSPIVLGLTLVSGIDIVNQYNLPITDMYVVNLDNPKLDPNISNLGSSARLFIVPEIDDV